MLLKSTHRLIQALQDERERLVIENARLNRQVEQLMNKVLALASARAYLLTREDIVKSDDGFREVEFSEWGEEVQVKKEPSQ